jgi:hypothetical protein
MSEADVLQWFADTWIGATTRNVSWLWPMLETFHFIGLCTLFGALMVVDLRVLGVGKKVPLAAVMPFIPVALAGFVLILISGLAFFCSNPPNYWGNPAFRAKMILVFLGGLNALLFEFAERRKLSALDVGVDTGIPAKTIAAASLLTWIAVISLGRLLPYTGGIG